MTNFTVNGRSVIFTFWKRWSFIIAWGKLWTDEEFLRYAPLDHICGEVPGVCENMGHHVKAVQLEHLIQEAYARGQQSRKPAPSGRR